MIKTHGLIVLMMLSLAVGQESDPEVPDISGSSSAFTKSQAAAVDRLSGDALETKLKGPSLGSKSDDNFVRLRNEIKAENPIPGVSEGKIGEEYDVILQPGHYGRPPGLLGTSGQIVSERALVAYITGVTAENLRKSGYKVLVVSADKYLKPSHEGNNFHGLTAKVFLAIHADGKRLACGKKGPSLGYPAGSDVFGMHAIGWAVSKALGYDYSDFNDDNFTANLGHYYMFSQVRAKRVTGVLEIGELTCKAKEEQLISSSELIGNNVAEGIKYIIKMPSQ
jgi:N-acetylmuramoyl-L-alanine amidase